MTDQPQKEHRKLAAIMFTDIVGYTTLMSKNEQKALQILQKNRDVQKPLIEKYNGEWLKEMGDGTLSCFNSAVDAVNCAIEIQQIIKDDPEFNLRIGIHVGDIVFKEGDIFGDGVNVASRIELLAEPGGITVSGRVYDDIRNKPDILTRDLGVKDLKNVEHPVRIYAVGEKGVEISAEKIKSEKVPRANMKIFYILACFVIVISAYFLYSNFFRFKEVNAGEITSIGVLPLDNLSGESGQEYVTNGIHDALISEISQIRGLQRVISRTSMMRFKDTDKSVPEIARELNVDALIEGSVFRAGNYIKINIQLIKGSEDRHVWADDFEGNMSDYQILLSEIPQAIAEEIKVALTPEEKAHFAGAKEVNPEAHELFLRGKYEFDKLSWDGFKKAVEYFNRSIAIDSSYAEVYPWLADSYGYLWLRGLLLTEEYTSRFTQLIEKALELNDALPGAHISIANDRFYVRWDWMGAEKEFKRAIDLNPNFARAHQDYAWFLIGMGRFTEAISEAKRGKQLDPISYPAISTMGCVYTRARQYDKAIEQYRQIIELFPNDSRPYWNLAEIYALKGMYEDAVKARKKEMTLSQTPPAEIAALDSAYSVSGSRGYWMWYLKRMKGQYESSPYYSAQIFSQLGEKDKAFFWLEEAYKIHDSQMYGLKVEPRFDPIRSDPRYTELLKKMGLDKFPGK